MRIKTSILSLSAGHGDCKSRQGKNYFESAIHITIDKSSRLLLNRLYIIVHEWRDFKVID